MIERYSAAQATVTFYFLLPKTLRINTLTVIPVNQQPTNHQQDVSSLHRSTFKARQWPRQVDSPSCPSSNPRRRFASVCFIFTFFTLYSLESLVRFKQLRLFCKDVWQLKTFYEVTMTGSWSSWGKCSHLHDLVTQC
jgi:hypothetical protein